MNRQGLVASEKMASSMADDVDLVVVGGGAAGLFAAWTAAERGASVCILERNRRPGVKILASGGGRCNLTTTRVGQALEVSFPKDQRMFLKPSLAALTPGGLRSWFEDRGVPTQQEEYEKVFPRVGRARVVLDALIEACEQAGVQTRGELRVEEIRPEEKGFVTRAGTFQVRSRKVILAAGGQSYPKAGTTGDGVRLAAALGHSIVSCRPALVGLKLEQPLRELSGIAIARATVRMGCEGKWLGRSDQPLLFTHLGLSGPGPMNVSRDYSDSGSCALEVDLLPGLKVEDLDHELQDKMQKRLSRPVMEIIPRAWPQAVRDWICRSAGLDGRQEIARVGRKGRQSLVRAIKRGRFPVSGTMGFGQAEVTRGGVSLSEVNRKTMESRLVPGFYVCGEVLDVDGPIGGFNFQAAFATGAMAGEAAAKACAGS